MKTGDYVLKPIGRQGILVEFSSEISLNNLDKVLVAKNMIKQKWLERKLEVINAYNSFLVYYYLPIEDLYGEFSAIEELLNQDFTEGLGGAELFHVPVCYDAEFGWDLEYLSRQKNLSVGEIIELHTKPIYTVYFIGFLPGFLYLGELQERLWFPRKDEPRDEVSKGAVGIGGNQTGIYPKKSPGGWQIIGNSPVSFFDKSQNPPCYISAGDKIKFYPVNKKEYYAIQNKVSEGNFSLKKENP